MSRGFPSGSEGKESACNAGDQGSIPGSERSPGEGNGKPTPVLLPGEFHGQGSLLGLQSMVLRTIGHNLEANDNNMCIQGICKFLTISDINQACLILFKS